MKLADTSELDQLFDVEEIRHRFVRLSKSSIERAIAAGAFPAPVSIGRRRFWRGRDLAAWIAEQQPVVEYRGGVR